MEDNTSAISLVSTGTHAYDRKERHVIRRINYMYDYFSAVDNSAHLEYCATEVMIADVLTKPMGGAIFLYFARRLKGVGL